jgi:hypothetical protein
MELKGCHDLAYILRHGGSQSQEYELKSIIHRKFDLGHGIICLPPSEKTFSTHQKIPKKNSTYVSTFYVHVVSFMKNQQFLCLV